MTVPDAEPIDLDAILAEIRARVREKRASGAYGPEVEAALRLPLPGGRPIFAESLADPLPSLADALDEEVEYDPRSRRPLVGPLITLARRAAMGLLRWWLTAVVERQERVNQLLARAVHDLRDRPAPGFDARLARLEREWKRFQDDLVARDLHSAYFQARFGGDEPVIRRQSEQFLELFRGRRRVLDLGSGRGTFLQLMRDEGIGAYGVDSDARMVGQCRERGLDAREGDGLAHLRSLPDASLDGLYARHVAEHILPGALVAVLREARRVLAPGSPVVMITPNVSSLSVGAHSFWLDPSHLRPIPPDLFRFYLEVEGFADVSVRTFAPSEERLSEDVPDGAIRENVRLLNRTLFADRDYAVIGRAPRGTPA
ncbi:MAG: class I SAM-dependent methyltransferase [Candidatus Limnocylindria bacterium]